MSRGQQGREHAKVEFVFAVLYVLVAAFLWIAAPQFMGGPSSANTWSTVLPIAAILSVVIGFAWMIRIYRASFNPEPDHRGWRYRARGYLRK